jgi:hypothetical protein
MTNTARYRVVTRQRDTGTGGWTYQIFVVGGDPMAFESTNESYPTQADAERAGWEAVAIKERQR